MSYNRPLFYQYKQLENHITHSLLLVLYKNPDLSNKLFENLKISSIASKIKFYSQQAPLKEKNDNSVLDGLIINTESNYSIGIENKVLNNVITSKQVNFHIDQLTKYQKPHLWLLVPEKIKSNEFKQIKWKNVKPIITVWRDLIDQLVSIGPDRNEVGKYLFNEFIRFIERCPNMTYFNGFHFEYGYDSDLAKIYTKAITEELNEKVLKIYPECINTRNAISVKPWNAWFSTKEVQKCIHPGFYVGSEDFTTSIVLANGCNKEWKQLSEKLDDDIGFEKFLKLLKSVKQKIHADADLSIKFRQRHYPSQRSNPETDGEGAVNVNTLLGENKSKLNLVWLETLKNLARNKNNFNLQAEVTISNRYVKFKELKSSKAISLIEKNFKTLQPIYEYLKLD